MVLMTAVGCKKKAAAIAPPAPAASTAEKVTPPDKPVIALFSASPSSIEKGQSSSLQWAVRNATDVSISPGFGEVQSKGDRQIFPSNNTLYTLNAKGPGGSASATATVDVLFPQKPPASASNSASKSLLDRLNSEVQDAYFDFDKADIRPDARETLKSDATALRAIMKDFPDVALMVEGHCDERGSAEFNLALGDRRAQAAKEFLTEFGVPQAQLKTISYGKERPQCTDETEACWQRNRRAHVSQAQ